MYSQIIILRPKFNTMNIDKYSVGDRSFYVVDDGKKYEYGTKQRITTEYVTKRMKEGFTDFVYSGPVNAMGAFALAKGCCEAGAKCTLFLCGSHLTPQSRGFTSNVKIRLVKNSLQVTTELAENYIKSHKNCFLVPWGINDKLYISLLKTSIQADLTINPQRIWLTVGSGVILSILLDLLPQTQFHAIQVGKALKFTHERVTTYWAPEKFSHPAKIHPPYSSLLNYDAKVWQFVLEHGIDSDVIWNVARNY